MQAARDRNARRSVATLVADESGGTAAGAGPLNDAVTVEGSASQVPHSTPQQELSLVHAFSQEVEAQVDAKNREANHFIPMPDDPSLLVPEFRRIKKSSGTVVVVENAPTPSYPRRDNFPQLPEAPLHGWARDQPIGPNIVHGDGFQNIVGTGEVGFENTEQEKPALPETFRGLRHSSPVGARLSQRNGFTHQDLRIKHSFKICGRGVFADKPIAKGTILMVVGSTAQHTGFEGELNRLGFMVADLLKSLAASCSDDDLAFLHDTVLTGQLSSIVERWPESATLRVLDLIGGDEVLAKLQLHRLHIGRLAAIMDMNGLLVESSFAERHGTGYWPEAGFVNHSCIPNVTYELVPQHTFTESEFYLDMLSEPERAKVTAAAAAATAAPQDGGGPKLVPKAQGIVAARPAAGPLTMTLDEIRQDFEEKQQAWQSTDLTASGTPQVIFCMRADRDLAAGEEVFLNYVPTTWNFQARQYALLHRYRFLCRCEKCAPTVDVKHSTVPRFSIAMVIFMVLLQLVAHLSRSAQMRSDEDILLDDEGHMPSPNDLGASGSGGGLFASSAKRRWEQTWYGDDEFGRAKQQMSRKSTA